MFELFLFCFFLHFKKRIPESQTESEEDIENTDQNNCNQPTSKYFNWSSNGTDTDSDGGNNMDTDCTSASETTGSEASTDEIEDETVDEDEPKNNIK